jgi:heme A synthase
MYTAVLIFHSWFRWIALILGVMATFAAFTDRSAGQSKTDRWGLFFMMVLDIQMLLGLLLYLVLSPFTTAALHDFGAAMRNPALRYWAVEHVSLMFFAVVIVHVGRVLARTARTPQSKRTRQIVCFSLATIAMIAATPWPGMANGRPWFRV